ncbi:MULTISPECIES: LacI family DNA-binding transcriptional regulator [Bifidobacterium]|nr:MULTISPECIES: LacI family DNA-binding transcriptional regulator [Bifidobacterium]
MGRPTIMDVAARAGVSQSTASLALRGSNRVRPATRERVLQAAEELHFTLSRSASSLASGRTMRIFMLVSPALNTWFNGAIMQGAYKALHRHGYDLIPYAVSNDAELSEFFATLRGGKNADGAIVSSFDLNDDFKRLLKTLDIPTIGLNTPTTEGFDASVCIDNIAAMGNAVRFLHSQGHRHLAFVEEPDFEPFSFSSSLRSRGFLDAARQLGYADDDLTVIRGEQTEGYHSPQDAISQIVARLLSAPKRPTGICVETDGFAVTLMQELRRQQLRIPEDCSVIGFDDDTVAAAVELTTIHQDPMTLGRRAAELVLKLIQHEAVESPHRIQETSLVLRNTTGPAPRQ